MTKGASRPNSGDEVWEMTEEMAEAFKGVSEAQVTTMIGNAV